MTFRDNLRNYLLEKEQEYEAMYSARENQISALSEERDRAWREFQLAHRALTAFDKEEQP